MNPEPVNESSEIYIYDDWRPEHCKVSWRDGMMCAMNVTTEEQIRRVSDDKWRIIFLHK